MSNGANVSRGTRRVYLEAGWVEAAIHDRADLRAGHRLAGPAIIEQADTTTLLLPGWHLRVDAFGNLHLTRDDA